MAPRQAEPASTEPQPDDDFWLALYASIWLEKPVLRMLPQLPSAWLPRPCQAVPVPMVLAPDAVVASPVLAAWLPDCAGAGLRRQRLAGVAVADIDGVGHQLLAVLLRGAARLVAGASLRRCLQQCAYPDPAHPRV